MSRHSVEHFKQYERAAEQVLTRRLPVVLRIDGHCFSRLTEDAFDKPFDERFGDAMVSAAQSVLEFCAGAEFAYVQSDETSILLRNDHTPKTDALMGNRTQKIASLTASRASVAFNAAARSAGVATDAIFDCRVFVLPYAELTDYFVWRQLDAFKNCVGMFAYWRLREEYGADEAHDRLHGLSTAGQQELIFQKFGVNANDIDARWKRGVGIRRVEKELPLREVVDDEKLDQLLEAGHVDDADETVTRTPWEVDDELPRWEKDPSYFDPFLPGS